MSTEFENAIKAAEAEFTAIITEEAGYVITLEKASYKVIEKIVALHRAGRVNEHEYRLYLANRQVEVTNRTINPVHPTTQALVPEQLRRKLRQRVTQYAQVAFVLVEQNVENCTDWFEQPEKVGKRTLTGLAKATAIYKSLPQVIAHNEVRKRLSGGDVNLSVPAIAVGYLDARGRFVPVKSCTETAAISQVEALLADANATAVNDNDDIGLAA